MHNYHSKYIELFDTVLLIVKKKPVIPLHMFHHAAILFIAWSWLDGSWIAGSWYENTLAWWPLLLCSPLFFLQVVRVCQLYHPLFYVLLLLALHPWYPRLVEGDVHCSPLSSFAKRNNTAMVDSWADFPVLDGILYRVLLVLHSTERGMRWGTIHSHHKPHREHDIDCLVLPILR